MFKWLRRLLGSEIPSDIHIHIHVDGALKLYHDGLEIVGSQGSKNTTSPVESGEGANRTNRTGEDSIGPECFTDLGTPEVSFGRDVELPPTGRKDEDNKIS